MNENLVTARELGERLSLSPSTVLDMWERDELPGFKIGRVVRFRPSEVEAWLEGFRRQARPLLTGRSRSYSGRMRDAARILWSTSYDAQARRAVAAIGVLDGLRSRSRHAR